MATIRKKRLRKTLPKDLGELMEEAAESRDYAAVHAALEACEVDARGGYAKGTPLMMRQCTPELAAWIVERGTDVNAQDQYGKTALHSSAGARFNYGLTPADLLALGADPKAVSKNGSSVLHSAAEGKHLDAVRLLLAQGVDVHAKTSSGLTALDSALQRMSNIDFVAMLPVVGALLEAGAAVSEQGQEFMRAANKRFEFHRSGFNKDRVEEVSAAMLALCERLGVEAAAPRKVHDGVSPIVASSATWQKQHAELWNLLVPSKGACETMQGEVIRIAGRIGDEIFRNGGMNWDAQYRAMARAFCAHLASHCSLDKTSLERCKQSLSLLPDADEGTDELAQLALKWVALNPTPIPLPAPTYTR